MNDSIRCNSKKTWQNNNVTNHTQCGLWLKHDMTNHIGYDSTKTRQDNDITNRTKCDLQLKQDYTEMIVI